MDARLDATNARVEQRLMECKMEMSEAIDRLQVQMAGVRQEMSRMNTQFARIDARIDTLGVELRAEYKQGISEVVKWVAGIFAGAMVTFVTVITFVLNHAS